MKRTNKWSPYEERVVKKCIKQNPENLQYCFFLASKQINRTRKAISIHYYSKLKHSKKGFLFTLFTSIKNLYNTKNMKKDYE